MLREGTDLAIAAMPHKKAATDHSLNQSEENANFQRFPLYARLFVNSELPLQTVSMSLSSVPTSWRNALPISVVLSLEFPQVGLREWQQAQNAHTVVVHTNLQIDGKLKPGRLAISKDLLSELSFPIPKIFLRNMTHFGTSSCGWILKIEPSSLEVKKILHHEFPDFTRNQKLNSYYLVSELAENIPLLYSSNLRKFVDFVVAPWNPEPLFLIGSFGTGKSDFLLHSLGYLEKECTEEKPIFYFSFRALENESVDKHHATICDFFSLASQHAPAILVFDDVDILFGSNLDSDESSQEQQTNIGYVLNELLVSTRFVWVILAVNSETSLNLNFETGIVSSSPKIILGQGGAHERNEMIENMLTHWFPNASLDIRILLPSCESCTKKDFDLVIHKVHASLESSSQYATNEMLVEAFEQHRPISLGDSVQTSKQKSRWKWDDIGGMVDAKATILNAIVLPRKFAEVMGCQNASLPPAGILLFGYPGCGKSLLARSAARACGLNMVVASGPELLDKFVGGSEANVRALFARARAAAPCVVVLDDLEVLAPKRAMGLSSLNSGSDSGGGGGSASQVADRVVNMLLTELDGVSGRNDVHVIGVTQRPDLIDQALLRPGRLGTAVLCDMPTRDERHDILLKHGNDIESSLKLNDWALGIADATEGYTGADLFALLKAARMRSAKAVVNGDFSDSRVSVSFESDEKPSTIAEFRVVVVSDNHELPCDDFLIESLPRQLFEKYCPAKFASNQQVDTGSFSISLESILQLLKETRPSLSEKTVSRLKALYKGFQSGDKPELKNDEANRNQILVFK